MARKKKGLMTGILTLVGVMTILFINEEMPTFKEGNSKINESSKESLEVKKELEIYFLDVGQADSILIRTGNKNMLIDAGNDEDGEKLVVYFQSLGISEFEYVVATHPHEDHIGGMDDVIKAFDIKTFYMSDQIHTTKIFEDMLDALEEKNYTYEVPKIDSKFNVGDAKVEVLYTGTDDKNINDSSIILMLKYGDIKVLFMGDAEKTIENQILEKDIKADVLKVAHHGSSTSTTKEFIEKVNPTYAVIEVGANNKYNLPSDTILKRLNDQGIKLYRTDEQGTILMKTDGKNIEFEAIETDTNG